MEDMININLYNDTMHMVIADTLHVVEPLPSSINNLVEGQAYCSYDYVRIYQGELKKGEKPTLYGFYLSDGKIIMNDPPKKELKNYSVDNIIIVDSDDLIDDIIGNIDSFVTAEDVEILNNNSEAKVPVIKELDSCFDKIIKQSIIQKGVNPKNYSDKLPKRHTMGNMISKLYSDKDMTTLYFLRWVEVLGLKFKIIVDDDGTDPLSPLGETIIFNSDTNRVTGEVDEY